MYACLHKTVQAVYKFSYLVRYTLETRNRRAVVNSVKRELSAFRWWYQTRRLPSNPMAHGVMSVLLIWACSVSTQAQVPERHLIDTFLPEPYDVRIKKAYLNGQYIPKNLEDALLELDKRMEEDAMETFKNLSEEEAHRKAFFSFGRWIMVKWGMEDGSRLTEYFRQQQIGVVEDMTRIIMISYHRKLNQKPLDTESLFQTYRKKRQEEFKARQKRLLEYSKKLEPTEH